MNKSQKKIVILCHDAFDYILNKTGNMLIRYRTDEVVAIIDKSKVGETAESVLGYGGDIPVMENFKRCNDVKPDTLVIGNASQGGFISEAYRKEVVAAIQSGCDIISGMHQFLDDDPELSKMAKQFGVTLTDLRRPPNPPNFSNESWRTRKVPVLLIVGTDCDTGKMTTGWEITQRLKARGRKVEFIGTGQTGILLSGSGVPIDAVTADFMAGEIEHVINQCPDDTELVIVEGQGSLTNQYYAGVTLGLLHGAMPEYMVMTHDPSREEDVTGLPMSSIKQVMKLHIDLMQNFRESKFLGINLLTVKLSDEDATSEIEKMEKQYEIATSDLIRFGDMNFMDAIEKELAIH
mgnify:FL=1|jgi:uncharacterized NAD-dependent epimerase/dehydratase family protein|tara:strand:- start:2470 stop:3516 length:1047 start_codon:yes stop_codon:yes gene_type:complete